MTRIAYFDCFSGASGDMLLGALLDAGLALDDLKHDLAHLGLHDYAVTAEPHLSKGISGTKCDVIDDGHDRPARNLGAVRRILGASGLDDKITASSLGVFTRLAEAEATVHGTTIDEVHFHEVGAIDSLVDIVGFCCGLRRLGIAQVYVSPLPLGRGTVRTEHGLLPVPAPATLALIASAGAPTVASEGQGEMVTPTGAALLTTLGRFERPAMRIQGVGYGFGTRQFPWANMLRVWVGELIEGPASQPHTHGHVHLHSDETHAHEHGHGHSHDEGHAHGLLHDHHSAHGVADEVHAHDHGHAHPHDHEHTHDHDDSHEHTHEHPHPHEHDAGSEDGADNS